MTFDDELRLALERLRGNYDWPHLEKLAALIKAAARPEERSDYCRICGSATDWPPEHTPDCALVALVRAINGEVKP